MAPAFELSMLFFLELSLFLFFFLFSFDNSKEVVAFSFTCWVIMVSRSLNCLLRANSSSAAVFADFSLLPTAPCDALAVRFLQKHAWHEVRQSLTGGRLLFLISRGGGQLPFPFLQRSCGLLQLWQLNGRFFLGCNEQSSFLILFLLLGHLLIA
jgi:hypothetical protein